MVISLHVIVVVLSVSIPHIYGVPTQPAGQQDGPCVGMNCHHGVLMHNDEAGGDEHKAEDQYLRFKEALDTAEKPEIGTKVTENELHKLLMHDGLEDHHEEGAELLPEVAVEKGPKDPNDFLHEGMHGEEGKMKHSWDNIKENTPVLHEPTGGDKLMHDVLMHGGEEHAHGVTDAESLPEVAVEKGPKDPNDFLHEGMHGEEGKMEHTWDNIKEDSPVLHEPTGGDKLMHDVLMHGGEEHAHEATKTDTVGNADGPSGPTLGEDFMHGVLMHGDKDHAHDDSENTKTEPFSDILEILNMDLDEEILKLIDIEMLLKKDMDEYNEWIKNNPSFQDDTLSGSTNIGVTDSILSDIELMKNRYLKNSNTAGLSESESSKDDDYPFTADDAKDILESGAAEQREGEDMRHFLELLGSTEPLNARHKVQLALLKDKLDKND